MNSARYFVAVVVLVSMPVAIGLWYLIHPFARYWRRIGPARTYAVLAVPCILAGWRLWRGRHALLGADLGTRPPLFVLAAAGLAAGIAISRMRRRHLDQRTLSGFPELSSRNAGRLLTEGIYARVRNPRYLEVLAFVLAYAAFANYVGTWIVFALCFPALHLVVLLEERELRDRFGAAYLEYCRRVPRYLPRRPG